MTAVGARVGGALGDRRILVALLATVVFLGSWVLLDHWFFAHGRIIDTPGYQTDGLAMRNGAVPYRDFPVEYPPGSLPAFLLPTYFGEPTWIVDYGRWFARLMAVCGVAMLAFVLLARPPRHGIVLVAVSPVLVGALILSRFDLYPAALVAAAVAAFVRDRHRLGWLALALAFAVKIYAFVLIPLAVVWTLRRRGREELARGIAIWLVAVAAVFGPFAIVAPHGLWESLWGQISRPIQVESLVAALLTTFGNPHDIVSHHSVAIAGHGGLETLTTVVEAACLVALWIGFARGPSEPRRFTRYAAACVCAFVVFGKVLSPQYLIWLVPVVALVWGRRGLAAAMLLAVAMIETQYWFAAPRYHAYVNGYSYAPLVLVRDLVLVALLAVLAVPAPPKLSGDA